MKVTFTDDTVGAHWFVCATKLLQNDIANRLQMDVPLALIIAIVRPMNNALSGTYPSD